MLVIVLLLSALTPVFKYCSASIADLKDYVDYSDYISVAGEKKHCLHAGVALPVCSDGGLKP